MPPKSIKACSKSATIPGFELVKRGVAPVSPPSPIRYASSFTSQSRMALVPNTGSRRGTAT